MEISRKIFERTAPVLASCLVKDASVYENQTKPDSNLAAVAAVLQAVTSGAQPVTKSKSAKEPGREVFNHFKTSSTTAKTTAKT